MSCTNNEWVVISKPLNTKLFLWWCIQNIILWMHTQLLERNWWKVIPYNCNLPLNRKLQSVSFVFRCRFQRTLRWNLNLACKIRSCGNRTSNVQCSIGFESTDTFLRESFYPWISDGFGCDSQWGLSKFSFPLNNIYSWVKQYNNWSSFRWKARE